MDFLDHAASLGHRSAGVWRIFIGFLFVSFGSLTAVEDAAKQEVLKAVEGPLGAEALHAGENRLAVENLPQNDAVPAAETHAPAGNPPVEAAPALSAAEENQLDQTAAGANDGTDGELPPAELLLAEDLFPELRPILYQAAEQAPGILARNVDRAIAEANAVIANSDRYPSVGGLLRYDYRREDRLDRPDISYSKKLYYFFQARYPIYHWGAVKAASDIGEIGVQLAEGQLETAYRQTIQTIRSQYLNLVIQNIDLSNLRATLDFRREELAKQRESYEAGEIASNRIGSLDFSLREYQLSYDRLESEFQFTVRQFARLVGDDTFTDASISDHFPEVGHNPDQMAGLLVRFVEGGFAEDPRVTSAELQIEQEKGNYRIYNVRNRPKFNLTAGLTQDEINYDANIANKYATTALFVGVSLNWSIFDGFETRGLKTASLLRLNRLRQARQELDQVLVDEANQAAKRVKFAAEALDMGRIRLAGTQGIAATAEKDFEAGIVSEDSLESSRRQVRDAETRVARLKADYLNSLSAFVVLVGGDTLVSDLENERPELGPEYEQKP